MKDISSKITNVVRPLLITSLIVSISFMLFGCTNQKKEGNTPYGVYTLEEMKSLNIEDPIIDKTKKMMSDYEKYFNAMFTKVEVDERIYYLENNITSKIRIFAHSDEIDKPYFSVVVDTNQDEITHVTIRLNRTYNGNFKESMNYIDKDQLKYVEDCFGVNDAYGMFKNTFKDIQENAQNVYASYTYDEQYEVVTKEQYYPEENYIELEYIIEILVEGYDKF